MKNSINLTDTDCNPSKEQLNAIMKSAIDISNEKSLITKERLKQQLIGLTKNLTQPDIQAKIKQKPPVLIVIAGANGSGKTTITEQLLKHDWLFDCDYLNADNIAQSQFGGWNSATGIIEAANYVQTKREQYLKEGKNFAFETVFSGQDKVDFLIKAKKEGYFIRLFYIGTESPIINASRVARRVMEGGHDVPISKIISRYSKSIANCASIINIVDRTYLYNNSKDNRQARLILRTQNGVTKEYETTPEWAQIIKNQLDNYLSYPMPFTA